jgi:hypothetical protein
VLQALGGQGKSQLALKYCRISRTKFRGVFWVDATSKSSATRSFDAIAAGLNKPVTRTFDDPLSKVRFVLDTIQSWKEKWLIVYDNYDQPEVFTNVKEFMPTSEIQYVV